MIHHEDLFKTGDHLSLFFQNWLPDQPPKAVLVIAHGIGEHSGRYLTLVNYFVPRGYAIYALDHRGHGRSPEKRGHIRHWENYREDLNNFIQFVRDVQTGIPIFLLGHSLGGLMVLDYVRHYPQGLRGVIASSPALAEPGISPVLIMISKIMSHIWPGLTVKTSLDVSAISHDPDVIKAYQEDPLVHEMGSVRLGTEFDRCRKLTLAHAADICCPLLLYHGKADRIMPYQGSEKFFNSVTFADKELHLIEEGFHELHHDTNKEQLFHIIEIWIDKHLEG